MPRRLSRAYPDPTLQKLVRTVRLSPDGVLRLIDQFAFTSDPTSIEEAFVTFEPVQIATDQSAVTIGTEKSALRLRTTAAGIWTIEEFLPEQHGGRDERMFRRIAFTPTQISRTMTLDFEMTASAP